MRIYSELNEAYDEIMRDLYEVGEWTHGNTVQDQYVFGDADFDFMELRPYSYMLTGWDDKEDYIDRLGLSRAWLDAEFAERINPYLNNPGEAYRIRNDVWSPFLEPSGRFSYTYNERFRLGDQFTRVIEVLKTNIHTRQAVISIYNPILDAERLGGYQRVPCSMFYQFMVRNGELELFYVMRSCDFFTHFPYDQLLALRLLEIVGRDCLGLPRARFTHVITSLHGFRKDFPKGVF